MRSMISRSTINIIAALNASSNAAQRNQEASLHSFLAFLTVSVFIFDLEIVLFILLKNRLTQL